MAIIQQKKKINTGGRDTRYNPQTQRQSGLERIRSDSDKISAGKTVKSGTVQAAGLGREGAGAGATSTLQTIRGQRSDLQALYDESGQAINPNDPKVKGIPTLQDWWDQYGKSEYPDVNLQGGVPISMPGMPTKEKEQILPEVNLNIPEQAQGQEAILEQQRKEAVDTANAKAQEIFDNIKNDDIDIRESQKLLDDIQEKLDTKAPEAPSMADLYADQKKQLGIEPLETELANIDSDIENIQTQLFIAAEEAGEKLMSTGEISREKGALQKRAEREIALKQIEKSAISRQLNNKIDTLNMVMDLNQTDYANAANYYQQELKNTTALYNLLRGAETAEETREDKVKTDAQNNLTVITNSLKTNGIDYLSLTPEQQVTIAQMELQSGYPSGFTSQVLADNPEQTIKSTASRTDADNNTWFDVLMQDESGALSVKSYSRGAGKGSVSSGGEIDNGNGDTIEETEWDKARKIIADNPDVSDDQLRSAMLEQTKLSGADISSLLDVNKENKAKMAGEFITKEYIIKNLNEEQLKADSEEWLRDNFDDNELRKMATDAGFTRGGFLGFGTGDKGIQDYLESENGRDKYIEGILSILEKKRKDGWYDTELWEALNQ